MVGVRSRIQMGLLGGRRVCGALLAFACAGSLLLLAAGGARAAGPPALSVPSFGQFRSVLAQGEGQTISATDLAAYELSNVPPSTFTDQQPLYAGVMPNAASLSAANLDQYYKDTNFGQMPGGVGSTTTPEPGVTIYRDKSYGMAHIYASTRPELMFGAGYAQAQERLFLMDVIRRMAEGRLAGLLGPSYASGDGSQLTNQDFSPQELTAQFNALSQQYGAAGSQAQQDILNFVAGINAYINAAKTNPLLMPAEYAALGATPAQWTVADTAAEAVFLVTQFTVSNGSEEVNAQMQLAFQKRFGRRWRAYYDDLREANDPEAFTVAKGKNDFYSDNTGKLEPRLHLNAYPDLGSIKPRNDEIVGPDVKAQDRLRGELPGWVQSLERLRGAIPHVESNAVMVEAKRSSDGHALDAMGPQVGYYSPQIFSEYELHGGGIDSEGVTFPGASPYPLIGHGIDFAWTGTSANGDNEDTFVERLCNPDGSAPSDKSTHYMYKGHCIPFLMRTQSVTTPVAPTNPSPSQTIVYQTMRSVHGPVFAYATVGGKPVALTVAKAVDFHEISAVIPFMQLSENAPTNVQSFVRIMGQFPGSENWFYDDEHDVGWIQSGFYQEHARHSDVDLPWWGDGRADWVDFNPATYTEKDIPASHRPQAINPPDGFIISWNNKEALHWHPPPTGWDSGPVQHALILEDRLKNELHRGHGKVDLAAVARVANQTATTDLREHDVYPWMRRVIGRVKGHDKQMVALLDAWYRSGSQRLAPNGSNVYGHSAAVALFDAWWPRVVRAEFEPALGAQLFKTVLQNVIGLPSTGFDYNWVSQVQKDMRSAGGARERGRYSRIYCGGGANGTPQPPRGLHGRALRRARKRCGALLLSALSQAFAAVAAKQGPNPANWKVYATCAITSPPSCDQEVPTTAGAVATPPFPWQDRGTYHQITEVTGHR
jgi:acyl-homoserine lactone acylase PvdQ